MCGRIFQIHSIQHLLRIARTNRTRNQTNFQPTYNMGPTNYIPAIRDAQDESEQWDEEVIEENKEPEKIDKKTRGIDFLKWGYQSKYNLIINARVEEMDTKYTFKPLLNTRRCVVMASGYYEWTKKKEPFMFKQKEGKELLMAAMYTENEEVFVLTRESFGDFAKVHDRMPVLLEDDEIDIWINCKENPFHQIIDKRILNQQKNIWKQIEQVQVAPHVNNIKEKSEKCMMSLKDYKEMSLSKGLGRFFQKKSETKEQQKEKEYQKEIDGQSDPPSKSKEIKKE